MCVGERNGQRAQVRAMLTFSFAFTSAPFASSASTTAKWPFKEATWSGVHPFCGAGEHRDQRLTSNTHTHYADASTNACTLSRFQHARAHTHACTPANTHTPAYTHKCTPTPYISIILPLLHANKRPTPLTAPELADDTTHSGSHAHTMRQLAGIPGYHGERE
jgi:hypothetical protein